VRTKRNPPAAATGEGSEKSTLVRRTEPSGVKITAIGKPLPLREEPNGMHGQGAGQAVPAARQGDGTAAAPLPCLNSNNSIERLSGKPLGSCPSIGIVEARQLSQGRNLLTYQDGRQEIVGGLSTSQKKAAFSLVGNIEHLAKLHGLARLGFLTLTFRENITDFREAQRRFNSLRTNYLGELFTDWIVTVEPQKRGAVHYHLVVVCREDIRTGFNFDAIKRRDYSSASPYLKGLWRQLRGSMGKYGFGRSELLPIRSTGEGIAKYVGKYLEKGCAFRGDQFKGARMVRYSQGWRAVSPRFSWNSPMAKKWRELVGQMVTICGPYKHFTETRVLRVHFGKSWAFRAMLLIEKEGIRDPYELMTRLRRLHRAKEFNGTSEAPW